ncbi:hypothetical protein CKM354_000923900 [Cercospora kikuchii]|uniref:Elongator complex protein 5 n=1 Tax=Cercospora kikuchii TaxID=84275 RepID=A0A9P3CSZ3_9PEZI|nr:uncharacterized protein CKM354_000923900 [Cercospora kikuchii]GIZ46100.1 hypothetical protein CKM354_000923900 [Cercospora kikuchii]
MPPSSLQHRRTHNLLLISRLLNGRDGASPFTLVLDSLEQSGKPILAEYMRRAALSKVQVIFVSFETLRRPRLADAFVKAWSQSVQAWQKEVVTHLKNEPAQKKLLVFDSLNQLSALQASNVPALLSSFIGPTSSLLALYHTDIPLPVSKAPYQDAYTPSVSVLLRYLATTIFTAHSLHHVLAQKAARSRSHAEPIFGLEQGIEGVLQSLGANGDSGLVLEMEHRRKSGRGVREWYFLPLDRAGATHTRSREIAILLEDHPEYRTPEEKAVTAQEEAADTTFELGLTEKQRRDRDGVVLPYYDAQNGGGDGGRILYDMGEEDDFDEEEDEI